MPLRKCPNCQTEHLLDTATFCPDCGHKLRTTQAPSPPTVPADDDLDFVVTEAHQDSPDFVGESKTQQIVNDLSLQTTADLVQPESESTSRDLSNSQIPDFSETGPIGDTASPPPPTAYDSEGTSAASGPPSAVPTRTDGASVLARLSDAEIKSIKDGMYHQPREYLSDEEKFNLLKSIDERKPADGAPPAAESQPAFGNAPIVPPKKAGASGPTPKFTSDRPEPKIAKRAAGIAYFAKSFIQIAGEQHFHEGEELVINGRCYSLRKKKINRKILLAVSIPLAALLLLLAGTFLSTDSSGGAGRIVGVVLDEASQPYMHEAAVRLPGLGKTFQANPQGFFKTELVEAGSHKVEYLVDGAIIGWDYATVVPGKITTLTLRPTVEVGATSGSARAEAPTRERAQDRPVPSDSPDLALEAAEAKEQPRETQKAPVKRTAQARFGRLRLLANVENARLAIDGSVVGAGNLTYSKLGVGKHSYTVSSDGYQTVSGTVELRDGKTTDLKVTLKPLTGTQKKETFGENDYYYSGSKALEAGDYQTAIADLTKAITMKPNYADAYLSRAEAHSEVGHTGSACDDFIRAAEQLRFDKQYNGAISAYNRAIDLDPKSIPALLGRASLYVAKGEEIPAIADYETVLKLDKRNFQAHYGLGEARFSQGYYKRAVDHFKDARSLDSGNPSVYQFLMLSYMGADDIKQVKKTYDKFRKLASEEELNRMRSDERFSAVLRIVED